jgi:hypothetical protein
MVELSRWRHAWERTAAHARASAHRAGDAPPDRILPRARPGMTDDAACRVSGSRPARGESSPGMPRRAFIAATSNINDDSTIQFVPKHAVVTRCWPAVVTSLRLIDQLSISSTDAIS